ncbi:phosphotransferase family protein [Pseudalkalibacillus caeni]|uniref:Aminoglycoside phosphotransferase family protein n=1 Tax=Exobacillus caeni TaxID=2574798 RepID=A0A5R9F3C6_9BACL|nr:aminoglycoside phosphotransferase family protein [Pseudalkalibacillus caeni]TLS36088.1 aminoglycoside phosphotransferase family protein [Pseudalkalibacillus caeni]
MKENWERVKPATMLSKTELELMILEYIPKAKLKRFSLLSGGLSNSNYKVLLEGYEDPFVVRLTRKETCEKEAAIHTMLAGEVPVPEVYYYNTRTDTPFLMMEWKEGVQLKRVLQIGETTELKEAGQSIGYWLSKLGSCSFSRPGFLEVHHTDLKVTETMEVNPETFIEVINHFVRDGKSKRWLGESLAKEVLQFAKKHAHLLNHLDRTSALVHSDFNGLNILVDNQNGQLNTSAILDWEFAFSGPIEVDIGNMLRYTGFSNFVVFENAFLAGLAEGGINLDKNWRKRAKLVDLIALCEMLNNDNGGKVKVHDLKSLIIKTLEDWENL